VEEFYNRLVEPVTAEATEVEISAAIVGGRKCKAAASPADPTPKTRNEGVDFVE
jgi:hypothetical protein